MNKFGIAFAIQVRENPQKEVVREGVEGQRGPTPWPSALWIPHASATMYIFLPRSLTSRVLSTLAGFKTLLLVLFDLSGPFFSDNSSLQLHAEDLVVLIASEADLEIVLALLHWTWLTKSATVVFGPLPGRLIAEYTLAFPLHLVRCTIIWALSSHPTFTSTFSAPAGRLFHQASAWSLCFSSSVFVTYFLSNSSSFGLEFIADDPLALQQFNHTLRRWCRHLLGWPSASDIAVIYWKFGIGDALHFALGRGFSLSGRLCVCQPRFPSPSGHSFLHAVPCRHGFLSRFSTFVPLPWS